MATSKITVAGPERRRRLRFPLDTELRYQISGRGHGPAGSGTGQVENISSRGLAFRADGPLEPGCRLSASMAWPAKLDDECILRLVFEGVVLRTEGSLVVLSIERPEFRTAGKKTEGARAEIAAMVKDIESLYPSKGAPPGSAGAGCVQPAPTG